VEEAEMSLGLLIQEHRDRRGLSQNELGKLTGLSAGYISKIEKGLYKLTSPDTIGKLARALKIRPEELYIAAGILKASKSVYEAPKGIQDLPIREIGMAYIEVPIVADMHAPGHVSEYIYLPKAGTKHTKLYGVKIIGNCLAPAVHDGDIIIIDKEDLDYYGKKILCYHNGNEHPEIIKCKTPADLETCEVYGVILWIMKKP
jgi:transcriptional regulator with XRE-family HTH domain